MNASIYDDQLIVITGAAGFIGSAMVRYFNELGYYNLLLVDDFHSTCKWKNLRNKRFIDIISRHQIFDYLEGKECDIGAFIHLGACSRTTESNGDFLMDCNYRFSVRLAEYALTHGHRFIYASSAATYGNGECGFVDSDANLNDFIPLNLYGFSKHLFDKWLYEQGVLHKVVGLKFFNIFGPNEYHKQSMASMVLHMVGQIQSTGHVKLFKSNDLDKCAHGNQCRDFLYIKEAVAMVFALLNSSLGGLFNIGSGRVNTWNYMAQQVFRVMKCPENIQYIPMPDHLNGQYQNYTCADMSKFNNERGKGNIDYVSNFPGIDFAHSFDLAIEEYVGYLLKGARW